MADGVEFRIEGLGPVLARMRGLAPKLRQKGTKKALGRAAAIVRKAAKQNALRIDDIETGRRIADNIVQRVRSGYTRRTGDVMVSVGVLTERGRIPKGNPDTGPKGSTPHWHLVEEGTEKARAQPFLRPALAANVDAVTNKFVIEFGKELDKALQETGA